MKRVIKIFLIVVAVIIIVILLRLNTPIDCHVLETKITRAINDSNFCEKDLHCDVKLVNESVCPFGCYQLVNRDAKLKDLKEYFRAYKVQCEYCKYECVKPPDKQDLKCINNKCVVQFSGSKDYE